MIIDKLEKWELYHYGNAWEQSLEFLITLTPDAEEKKYELIGNDIFAQVTSYKTHSTETALLETHRKYVDIHATLSGCERIEVLSRDGLVIDMVYDELKDAEFYRHSPGQTHIDLYPGTFALFFSHDAHMPGLMIGKESELVKKVVVKIKIDLLLTGKQ